jgi:hypothetical protein
MVHWHSPFNVFPQDTRGQVSYHLYNLYVFHTHFQLGKFLALMQIQLSTDFVQMEKKNVINPLNGLLCMVEDDYFFHFVLFILNKYNFQKFNHFPLDI